MMSRLRLFALLAPALLLTVASTRDASHREPPAPVVVTNFPETQRVTGSVAVEQPVPATRLVTLEALVSPAAPTDLGSLTEGGLVDAVGFVSGTLSLTVAVQGSLHGPGKVGAMLIPDQAEILAAMRSSGVVAFPIVVEAEVAPSTTGLHQAGPSTVRLGFPRYRVFFYNTTPRTSQVTLYSYLGTS